MCWSSLVFLGGDGGSAPPTDGVESEHHYHNLVRLALSGCRTTCDLDCGNGCLDG